MEDLDFAEDVISNELDELLITVTLGTHDEQRAVMHRIQDLRRARSRIWAVRSEFEHQLECAHEYKRAHDKLRKSCVAVETALANLPVEVDEYTGTSVYTLQKG